MSIADDEQRPRPEHRPANSVLSGSAANAVVAGAIDFLGLHPGQEISTSAAAALAGITPAAARADLDRLVSAHMVEPVSRNYYQFHDLLRAYALEEVAGEPASVRLAAVNREVAWYAYSAANAVAALQLLFAAPVLDPLPEGCTPAAFSSRDAAIAWYESEQQAALALIADYDDTGIAALRRELADLPGE